MDTTNTTAIKAIEVEIRNKFTGAVMKFPTVDAALRNLQGQDPEGRRFNQVLLDSPSRRKFKESVYLLENNGFEIVSSSQPVQTPTPQIMEEITNTLEKAIEKEKAAPVKAKVSKDVVEIEHDDVFAMMARELKKHLPTPEVKFDAKEAIEGLRKEMSEMIQAGLSTMTKDIVVTRPDGVKTNVGKQHHQFATLLAFVAARVNTVLVGPAGSGKTTAADKVAQALGLPFYSMSVGSMTTKTDFLGYMDANGHYVKTLFRTAFEHGGVFLIDEMDAGNANVITIINQALANSFAAFPDGMAVKHPDFVVIASANTYGTGANREYVGRNQLDAATLDRFAVINWNYDEALENELCPNKTWLAFVRVCRANADKNKIRTVVSPRASIMGAQLIAQGVDLETVKQALIYKGLNETEKMKLVEGA